ncbi:MAG: PD40 domain-containing protein [Anaerolineae bacterium]|nr:PD40 domain-containing protein [Anaerolineae bacterium]MCB9107945.1 PD40 domain-containing protein [Anaerolineales bacterium]
MAGRPTGITADVFGDGSGHFLNVWVKDSQGEIWAFTFGQIKHEGWQSMTAVIDTGLGWPNEHIDGPGNKVIDYPLAFYALVLDDAPDNQIGSGVIYVDNLATTFDPLPDSKLPTAAPAESQPVTPVPSETPTLNPVSSGLTGRIAFPVDRSGYYDIWIADLSQFPDVSPYNAMKGARQPNFNKKDGRLLANGEDNLGDRNLRLYSSGFDYLSLVSESPFDAYPFWAPGGERLVYSRDNNDRVYVNCSLTRPSWESGAGQCNDLESGIIITERNGHLVAEMPVWMQDGADLIVRWLEPASKAGLARIGSWATNRDKDSIDPLPEPVSLLRSNSARPTDTFGDMVYFFASDLDGNWEVYGLNIGGGTPVNLSNSPGSNDGLPTVSPDGRWVAFASDRSGRWAIWVVPTQGGTPQKLFDMPQANPWGRGDHDWITERISWGP